MNADQPAVEVRGLTRSFRSAGGPVHAVRDLSLTIGRGELFGLLGPNGAGKTTTIRMLITTLLPTSGSARVLGFDVVDDVREVRRRIGFVLGGDKGLYDRLSALDNMRYFADLYGVPPRVQRTRIPELLDRVGLLDVQRRRVETFSRGMWQRLHLARGLLHEPEVLVLDEPGNGLDPVGARDLRRLVRELVRERGCTVLLTTHQMDEADQLCDRLAVMVGGRLTAEGSPAALKASVVGTQVTSIELHEVDPAALHRLGELPQVTATDVEGAGRVVHLHTPVGVDVTVAALAVLADARVSRVSTRGPTLDDAYVQLVGAAP